MSGNTKMLHAFTPRSKSDGGTWWHRIGTAWQKGEKMSIVFDSLPLPDENGRVVVHLFEPKEDNAKPRTIPAAKKPTQTLAEELDDEIPF